jgi:hypothetical protein
MTGRPEALVLRPEWVPFEKRPEVLLTGAGMGWQTPGAEDAHWLPWLLIGGFSGRLTGRTWTTDVLALDGSRLGSIVGQFVVDNAPTSLGHVVATFRPDLFVEIDEGCIRRDLEGRQP